MFLRLIFGSALMLAAALPQPFGFPPARTIVRRSARSQVIRAEADLVVLPVTVKDHHGDFVSGLAQEDFEVYENGERQTISLFHQNDVPVTAGLVVDSSGSMAGNRSEVVDSARDFLSSSNPRDQIFVVNFNEKVSLGLPSSIPFTGDVSELEAAVLRGPSTGMTALYDATNLALKHLALGTADKKALIVISDGGDNASHRNFRELLLSAQRSNAIIYTIGIMGEHQKDVNPGVLRKMAKATGGEAYFPQSAADLPGICQRIARDLREQYTIGYVPSDSARAGTYRAIRVTVHAPGRGGLAARTRTGYFAHSGPEQVPVSTP